MPTLHEVCAECAARHKTRSEAIDAAMDRLKIMMRPIKKDEHRELLVESIRAGVIAKFQQMRRSGNWDTDPEDRKPAPFSDWARPIGGSSTEVEPERDLLTDEPMGEANGNGDTVPARKKPGTTKRMGEAIQAASGPMVQTFFASIPCAGTFMDKCRPSDLDADIAQNQRRAFGEVASLRFKRKIREAAGDDNRLLPEIFTDKQAHKIYRQARKEAEQVTLPKQKQLR